MKGIKNYVITFMDGEEIGLTVEQAATIVLNLSKGTTIIVGGDVYAVHQMKSIKRVNKQIELDLYDLKGIENPEDVFLTQGLATFSTTKQLN
jgi:hypothetical protein